MLLHVCSELVYQIAQLVNSISHPVVVIIGVYNNNCQLIL